MRGNTYRSQARKRFTMFDPIGNLRYCIERRVDQKHSFRRSNHIYKIILWFRKIGGKNNLGLVK